jgi:hypothetical protein
MRIHIHVKNTTEVLGRTARRDFAPDEMIEA